METQKLYISPITEVCVLHANEVFMLQASLHDDEAEFVGAKENKDFFDFDDDSWGDDPWADTDTHGKDPWKD